MTTRHHLHDAGHYLRAAAPPVLTLGMLTVTRSVCLENPALSTHDSLLLPAWQAAIVASELWLVFAVSWATTRPWRDRRAHQRLEYVRELAAQPNRALVHVKTTLWSTTAGQHAVVLNVATGVLHRVWLPETTVPIGAFVALERTNGGVRVIDWMNAQQVEAGHRHEARRAGPTAGSAKRAEHVESRQVHDAAAELVRETEEFLRRL